MRSKHHASRLTFHVSRFTFHASRITHHVLLHNVMSFYATIQLTRPLNALIGFVSVCVAAFVAGSIQPLWKVGLASTSVMLILAGGNVVNDLFDVAIDRINNPTRPLVAGTVSSGTAWVLAVLLFGIGMASVWGLGPAMFGIAGLAVGLLVLYSAKLKRTLLWGNLTVSFLGGLVFVYGGMAVGKVRGAAVPAILAFLFHLGREILKDVEDRTGDGAAQANTVAVRFGAKGAFGLATGVFGMLILVTPLPFLFKLYALPYLLMVLVGVDAVLVYVVWSIWRDGSRRNLARLGRVLKVDMLVGLMAIVLGKGCVVRGESLSYHYQSPSNFPHALVPLTVLVARGHALPCSARLRPEAQPEGSPDRRPAQARSGDLRLAEVGNVVLASHFLTCSRAHVLTCSRAHALTCSSGGERVL